MSEPGEGELDEIVACSGLIEKRTKQNEEKDKRCRYTQRDPEDTARVQPLSVDQRLEREAFVFDQVRDQPARAHVRIKQEDRTNDGQRGTKRTTAGFQKDSQSDCANDDLCLCGQARARGQRKRIGEEKYVKGAETADQHQRPVCQGYAVAWRILEGRIGKERQ